jgi:hypothetical protein
MSMHSKFQSDILKESDHCQDLGIDERILKWILENRHKRVWPGFTWLRARTIVASCREYGNVPSDTVKC